VPKARLYHSNRKQGFTFKLEEGRVVIEGFVNEINNKLCVVQKARTLSFYEIINFSNIRINY
jgi:hypothetical protein